MVFIGEASRLSGVSIKAIRHYEKVGLLPNLVRSGSYRTFSNNDIQLIKLIKEAGNIGFKLSEFKSAFELNDQWKWSEIERLIRKKELEINKEINILKQKQIKLVEYSRLISDCLDQDPNCSQTPSEHLP